MDSLHYGVVRFEDRWKVVGKGLRWGDFASQTEALAAAQRLADQARGLDLDVTLHAHDADGVLHQQG
ncbi:MAG: hypothetical protein JWP35_513 [Caulobacter sp.]|jgi:hypothetical protein|nr:hypothetical protein [Caulobacter sp.]